MAVNDKHVLIISGSSVLYGTKPECEDKLREISGLSVKDALASGEYAIRRVKGAE